MGLGSEEMWESKCFCPGEAERSAKGLCQGSQQINWVFPVPQKMCRNICMKTEVVRGSAGSKNNVRDVCSPLRALWMLELFCKKHELLDKKKQ